MSQQPSNQKKQKFQAAVGKNNALMIKICDQDHLFSG
jgi:hypothetical protein|tara:strand:+ start:368 stop:478 length:111 start_codon:yes stop_codon:yes gene_type:complete